MTKREIQSRHIKPHVQQMLWGISAGRCQFSGCNKRLWENGVTKEQVNISQKAHIWSFSPDGPRGNEGINPEHINDLRNLMLVCHKLIDEDKEGKIYSVSLLMTMKREHEDRIDLATSITPNKQSHILLYGANIGEHSSPVNYKAAAEAIFPSHYPAEHQALELGLLRNPTKDHENDSVATSLPIFDFPVKNRLANATTDSFCPDRPAYAASPYDIGLRPRYTTTRLPQMTLRRPYPLPHPLHRSLFAPNSESADGVAYRERTALASRSMAVSGRYRLANGFPR